MERNNILTFLAIANSVLVVISFFLIFSFPNQKYLIWILMALIAVLLVLIALYIVLNRKPKQETETDLRGLLSNEQKEEIVGIQEERRQWDSLYNERIAKAQKIVQKKLKSKSILQNSFIVEFSGILAHNEICMVCKLMLDKQDEIFQCPFCESLYHKDHLLEWITAKKKCPVCSQKLYKK